MSVDKWDAADLSTGPHRATPASMAQDGHGREALVTERVHNGSSIELHTTATTFLSTGEAAIITRTRVGASDPQVTRWMEHDSLGRMVFNVEPNTVTGYVTPPAASQLGGLYVPPSSLKAWRYAHNDGGDLVGTSDARGCGANFTYDAGGRITSEDFSPCLTAQALYSAPNLATGDGTEAYYVYDAYDTDSTTAPGYSAAAGTFAKGRLIATFDRGAKTTSFYDGRGRMTGIARRVVQPGAPSDTVTARYPAKWYAKSLTYDGADRPVTVSTGIDSDVSALLDASGHSQVTTQYSQRGTVCSVSSGYGAPAGSALPLVASVTRDADGLVTQMVYGDAAKTTTAMSYDGRRRLSSVQTYRGTPAIWTSPPASYTPAPSPNGAPSTFQLLLDDEDYVYDEVDNAIEIRDWRNAAEWPAGAQPVSRKIAYDDLYRATQVSYVPPNGAAPDSWVSPFDAEDKGINADPRRATPSPRVSLANRAVQQSFQYDWLGNTTRTDDDAHAFYDRSLGAITNGSASAGPYQIQAATGAASTRGGSLSTAYDATGNLASLSIIRAGPCLPSGAVCSQRFAYDWDEVGHLVHARRWDMASPGVATSALPTTTPNAELKYAYDSSDHRVLKTAIDGSGNQVHSLYVFDSLELRRTTFASGDYVRSTATAVAYLQAHGARVGRVHYAAPPTTPTEGGSSVHLLLELADHLASTATVIDRDSSEVVERGTYLANGGPDSDYRPARWDSFREDYRFTGKEEDTEVGLQYFGKRFLAPALGRWVSADPLSVHQLSADPNVYAYVSGRLLTATDPTGLACPGPCGVNAAPSTGTPAPAANQNSGISANTPLLIWDTAGFQYREVPHTGYKALDWAGNVSMSLWNTIFATLMLPVDAPRQIDEAGQKYLGSSTWDALMHEPHVQTVVGLEEGASALMDRAFLLGERLVLRPPAAVAGVHPGRLAAESTEVSQASIMRELRQAGTPEALATSKLIKRGTYTLEFHPTDFYRQGAGARKEWAPDPAIYIFLDRAGSSYQAAQLAAHEVRHGLQGYTQSTYQLSHELDAYLWQSKAFGLNWSMAYIRTFVRSRPDLYGHLRGWPP
jgi:RHS repeat-associated protein